MMRFALLILLSSMLLFGGCRRSTQPEQADAENQKAKPSPQKQTAPIAADLTPTAPTTPSKDILPPVAKEAAKPDMEAPAEPPVPAPAGTEQPAEPAGQAKPAVEPAIPATQPAVVPVPPSVPKDRPGVKTRIVRSLLDALDTIQGLEDDQKRGLIDSLTASDAELSKVLGGNSKELILRANKKPPVPMVGGDSRPVLILPDKPLPVPAPVSPPPTVVPPPDPAAPAAAPSPAVQSLLKALDGIENEDPRVKSELRKAILDAEKKLAPPQTRQP